MKLIHYRTICMAGLVVMVVWLITGCMGETSETVGETPAETATPAESETVTPSETLLENTPVPEDGRVYIPYRNMDVITNTAEGEPDDVMPAPGLGPQYRANIIQQGEGNPWPSIQMGGVTLQGSVGPVSISYRPAVVAIPGEVKYNIIKVFPGLDVESGRLYAVGAPDWLILTDGLHYTGSGMMWCSVLVMEIGHQAPPGTYVFDIGIEVNGTDYGTLPVTLEVIT